MCFRAGNHSVDLDSNASINYDNEKGLRLNQVDKDTIRIKGEVDFNSTTIAERQEVFNVAERFMNDIN